MRNDTVGRMKNTSIQVLRSCTAVHFIYLKDKLLVVPHIHMNLVQWMHRWKIPWLKGAHVAAIVNQVDLLLLQNSSYFLTNYCEKGLGSSQVHHLCLSCSVWLYHILLSLMHGCWPAWERGSYFTRWHYGHLFAVLYSLTLPCEHSQAGKRKEPLCGTHLTLKSSAASLALSISSMIRAFSRVFFLT